MEATISMSTRSLQFYFIAKKWSADLEFYKIEVTFFHSLIEDHFMLLSGAGHISDLRIVSKGLLELEGEISNVDHVLSAQIKQVELMAEDIIPEDQEAVAITQIQLEYMVNKLIRDYRQVKAEIFTLVEKVIRETNLSAKI